MRGFALTLHNYHTRARNSSQRPGSSRSASLYSLRRLVVMPRIQHSILIRKPAAQIYDYLTTPKHWPEFHPASLEETGATEHPLTVGDRHRERFRTRGWTGYINWTTLEADRPLHFRMRGEVEGMGGKILITF